MPRKPTKPRDRGAAKTEIKTHATPDTRTERDNRNTRSESHKQTEAEVSSDWVTDFIRNIRTRNMMEAAKIFAEHLAEVKTWSVDAFTPIFLDSCARLLDRDPKYLDLVDQWVTAFRTREKLNIGRLQTLDTTHLMLAQAIVQFQKGQYKEAIEPLRFIRRLADECEYDDLRAMTRYYLSRALYRTGGFSPALEEILEAESILPHDGAFFDLLMVKTWILFSEKGVPEARAALEEAEKLLPGRDYVDAANLKSIRGRFARQVGQFDKAADDAREAIKIFEDNEDYSHPLLARAHVHRAFALLLKAQDDGIMPPDTSFDLLRAMAFESFGKAEEICGTGHKRILDRVHYFRGAWYLYLEDFKHAKVEAAAAYDAALQIDDHVIMAHVRILQCQCARKQNAPEDAKRFALEAKQHADATDNRRVRARARIWLAMTEADPPLNNYTAAQAHKEDAQKWMQSGDRDYLSWELSDLESHLKPPSSADVIEFPRLTVDEVLTEGNLDQTLKRLAKPICKAVLKRVKAINTGARKLGIGRPKFRELCDIE